MIPLVKPFFDPITSTFTYIVYDQKNKVGVIIDPVLDFDVSSGQVSYQSANEVLAYIKRNAITVDWILETHAHADHLTAAQYLKSNTGAKVGIGEGITHVQKTFKPIFDFSEAFLTDGSQFDHCFQDGDTINVGEMTLKVMSTPGHTNDSVTYVIGDAAFIGDTMFHPQVGTARCDFPGGDAETLYQSIQKILSLPADTRIFLCHDYPGEEREPVCEVSIKAQRTENIHINDNKTSLDFITFRHQRDAQLAVPKLIYPAIQVNIAAGHFPSSNNEQACFLKSPVFFPIVEEADHV